MAQLLNSSLWEVVWQREIFAERPSEKTYRPIPTIEVPVLFEKPLVAVLATTREARPTWRFAGSALQRISTGLLGGGSPDAVISTNEVWLGRIRALNLASNLSTTYGISYLVPRWFMDINLTFWQYTGDITGDNDIRSILLRIEQKVDDISEFSR